MIPNVITSHLTVQGDGKDTAPKSLPHSQPTVWSKSPASLTCMTAEIPPKSLPDSQPTAWSKSSASLTCMTAEIRNRSPVFSQVLNSPPPARGWKPYSGPLSSQLKTLNDFASIQNRAEHSELELQSRVCSGPYPLFWCLITLTSLPNIQPHCFVHPPSRPFFFLPQDHSRKLTSLSPKVLLPFHVSN